MNLNLKIENFKSIRSAHINLKSGLNILVGPNGSGKTCVLSALEFIRDILRLGAAQALARSGGAKRVYHRGQKTISFTVTQDYGPRIYRRKRYPCEMSWRITLAQRGPEKIGTIISEKLEVTAAVDGVARLLYGAYIDRSSRKTPKFRVTVATPSKFGRDIFSSWESLYPRMNKWHGYRKFRSRINRSLRAVRKNPDKSFYPVFAGLDESANGVSSRFIFLNEYNIVPDIARAGTEQFPFAQMRPDGGRVSEVIHALENKHFHKIAPTSEYEHEFMDYFEPGPYSFFTYAHHFPPYRRFDMQERTFSALNNALAQINKELAAAVRPIEAVSVQIDGTTGKRFVVFRAGNETFLPEEVSDGTVKWLCLLVSILVPYSKVYLLEEPENFLHPWMQQRLVEMMRNQADREGTIFVLTSHSATVLNAARPSEILIVNQSPKGTQVSEVTNRKQIDAVLSESNFGLGDLWVSGAISGVPSNE